MPGAERLNFGDALKHWEGRFHTITLEDRNLPAIAEKRVLKCKSEAAREELDAAFEQTQKIREAVMNTLLTSEGDREMFRKVYPFSPALVQTLIAVSSVLQRERTALKVMLQLLVDQRDTLQVGDLVPVGDLFDVSPTATRRSAGDGDPLRQRQAALPPEAAAGAGEAARATRGAGAAPVRRPKRAAFRNDDRLVKTLLLVGPGAGGRIAAGADRRAARRAQPRHDQDAHPGPEGPGGAAAVPDLGGERRRDPHRRGDQPDDLGPALGRRHRERSSGRRAARTIRATASAASARCSSSNSGSRARASSSSTTNFLWRNTERTCVVLFRNIRELPGLSLENQASDWKLVIDFPFDEAGHGPRDDLSKLQPFRQHAPERGEDALLGAQRSSVTTPRRTWACWSSWSTSWPASGSRSTPTTCRRRTGRRRSRCWRTSAASCGSGCRTTWRRPTAWTP